MKQKTLVGLGVIMLALAVLTARRGLDQAVVAQTLRQVPIFEVDPTWPKLPNNWVMGVVSAVAVDRRDHDLALEPLSRRRT